MTTPATGSTLMRAAQLASGRTPIATAVLVKGHQKVHAAEYLDGDTVILFQSGLRKKSVIRAGKVIESGESSFVGCKQVQKRMDSIIAELAGKGYQIKEKVVVPITLPLLPMEQVAKAA